MKDKKFFLRGYEIIFKNNEYLFKDTKEPTITTWEKYTRNCGYCGKANTKEGHDGCLGTLPGVKNACCGHGQILDSYVQFLDESVIGGQSASIILSELKKYLNL